MENFLFQLQQKNMLLCNKGRLMEVKQRLGHFDNNHLVV